jgi:hypothetical protein
LATDARAYADEADTYAEAAEDAAALVGVLVDEASDARDVANSDDTTSVDAVAASQEAVAASDRAAAEEEAAKAASDSSRNAASLASAASSSVSNANTATEQAIAEAEAAIAAAAAALAAAGAQTTALTLAGENLKKLSTRTMLRDVGLLEDGVGAWEVGYGQVRLAGVDGPPVAVPNGFVPPLFQKYETVQKLAKAAYDSLGSFRAQGLEDLCMKSFDAANPPPIITSPLKAKMSDWDTRKLQEYQSARAVHLAEAKAYAAASQKSIAASKRFFRLTLAKQLSGLSKGVLDALQAGITLEGVAGIMEAEIDRRNLNNVVGHAGGGDATAVENMTVENLTIVNVPGAPAEGGEGGADPVEGDDEDEFVPPGV